MYYYRVYLLCVGIRPLHACVIKDLATPEGNLCVCNVQVAPLRKWLQVVVGLLHTLMEDEKLGHVMWGGYPTI